MSETRHRTVRVALDAIIAPPSRRGAEWSARIGDRWMTSGCTSEKAAVDALSGAVRTFVAGWESPAVLQYRGHVAVVFPAPGTDGSVQWCVREISSEGRGCESSIGAANQREAIAWAKYSLAQRAADWFDDDSVHDAADYLVGNTHGEYSLGGPDELYGYAAWQRAARAAIDAGSADYHGWATEHAREFAVPARTAA
jgi:hypothetical protein